MNLTSMLKRDFSGSGLEPISTGLAPFNNYAHNQQSVETNMETRENNFRVDFENIKS